MRPIERALFSAASAIAVAAACSGAMAQTAAADQAKPADKTTVSEVVVTGVRASMRDAIAQKKVSANIVESISSKDIGVLPDVTIADELDRLPGINATRDRGNDSQAAVRGLGPRLVLGLVNGREVASSEPDRNVRWEIYPSEDVSGVTVYKSQSADLIAGGVAATIDIRTLRPLDYSGPKLVVRLGPLYNDGGASIPNYSPWGLRGSAEYVAKINDDLAVSVGGSYQQQKNGYVSFQGWGYNTPYTGSPPTLNGVVINTPWGAQTEVDGLTETRGSFTTAAQWKPSDHFEVNFDLLYSDVSIDENQEQAWYSANGKWGDWGGNNANSWDPYNSANGTFTVVNGDVVGATLFGTQDWMRAPVTNVIAHYTEDKSLLATGLNGVWRNDDWKVRADLSYSGAWRTNKWQAVESGLASPPASLSFFTGAGSAPSVTASSNPADPTAQAWFYGASTGPEHLNDELGAAQIDFSRTLHGDFFTGIDFGARYSHRVKGHDLEQWNENQTGTPSSSLLSSFTVSGLNVPALLNGNFGTIAAAAFGGFNTSNSNVVFANSMPTAFQKNAYWKVREGDAEAYVKVDFSHDVAGRQLTGNAGVRVISVDTTSNGFQRLNNATDSNGFALYTPDNASNKYTEALPSLNLNYALTDNTKLRFGAARVISRPPLDELRAGRSLFNQTLPYTGTAGNPKLMPFLANQVDVSWEWYFHPESMLAVAAYYKNVDSNIGYKTSTATIDGTNYLITGPFNGKGGDMEGIELTFQTPFYFVPHLDHFGVYSNLALAGSSVKEFSPVNNPLPMVGLANTTAEFDLWYSQAGFDTRLGLKYHSPFTVIYGWDASQLTRLESETTLGFSASYQFNKNFSVRFQANNLTDQVSRYYWNNDPQQLARYDKYGRSYLLDFTYKY
ncbi:TonB-dependent receptor [Phenylobacterium montanum]|uniref:TonB-dependent receptor n=1 Tax=Phenylobacterium montanum TaxID=2823693 RepID=A0A975FZG5_9CAUL|nr:TonB-dependent receptor [Caulobacter sp. S6]QUD88295.1 TonB-dependent receptor [Caulobacter sp. S6]